MTRTAVTDQKRKDPGARDTAFRDTRTRVADHKPHVGSNRTAAQSSPVRGQPRPLKEISTVNLREDGKIIFDWPDLDFPTMEFTIVRLEPPTLFEHTRTSPG